MNKNSIYITNEAWFEEGALKNPIPVSDHKIEKLYPEFYNISYDLRALATKPAGKEEKAAPFYNDYRERYGTTDITVLDQAAAIGGKHVFLNGFSQQQLEYMIPLIQDKVEVLYLFKCLRIADLSLLSRLKKLKCLFMYGNHSAERLWDMRNNPQLKVISLVAVNKLKDISGLAHSGVEFVTLDSEDNCGNAKEMLFNKDVFDKTPCLKHLTLCYQGCKVDY